MLVDDAFDLVNEHGAVFHQTLPEVGELPDLGIDGTGWKNSPDIMGTLSAFKPFPIIPKECTEGIGIAFVSLVQGRASGPTHQNLTILAIWGH